MTQLFIIETEEVISEQQFRLRLEQQAEERSESLLLPSVIDWSEYGAAVIFEGAKPTVGNFEDLQYDGIKQDSKGNYVTAWKVAPWSEERIESTLANAKTAKNAEINKWRLEANKTMFIHNGKTVQCDELSRGDIDAVANSVALKGTFPFGFPGGWKAADNSIIPLPTVDSFKAFHDSMTAQGTANFNKSQQLKAQLAAAETIEEVNAITW